MSGYEGGEFVLLRAILDESQGSKVIKEDIRSVDESIDVLARDNDAKVTLDSFNFNDPQKKRLLGRGKVLAVMQDYELSKQRLGALLNYVRTGENTYGLVILPSPSFLRVCEDEYLIKNVCGFALATNDSVGGMVVYRPGLRLCRSALDFLSKKYHGEGDF